MGAFGDAFKLGVSGTQVTLPDPVEFHEDVVRNGGVHELLNGKKREDHFGNTKMFFISWEGLTETEVASIEGVVALTGPLVFTYWRVASINVIIAGSEPVKWSHTGYGSMAMTLEEA
jgi:hypothetical protein